MPTMVYVHTDESCTPLRLLRMVASGFFNKSHLSVDSVKAPFG